MRDEMKKPYADVSFDYTDSYGDVEKLYPEFDMYRDGDNLYLGFYYYDTELEGMEHYCTATVNLYPLEFLHSAIDTNNNGDKMLAFLEKNGFGERTGQVIPSGFCAFPVFKFNADKIKELNPDFFEFYSRMHGIDNEKSEGIDSKIENATKKAEKSIDRNKDEKDNIR